jgi:protein TonB
MKINIALRSLDAACDKELIRLVRSMPRWKPGVLNNKAVTVWYCLPVNFRLQE